ncbi:uncharacterized protein buc2l isoform X2 [Pseudorasbora parva]|uniref:uncharacterized protein buc2l isoform X2 n=1 Tax=Pseudorasbora parva TaxID=51549 RepID=UPI00351E5219
MSSSIETSPFMFLLSSHSFHISGPCQLHMFPMVDFMGYGMVPLLPPCLEVPGYMIPQAQLPLMDYRRMTPHVAPTIAHQTRHSHFQNSVSVGRVMVSSEVQTEPLCHGVDSHGHAARYQTSSESGRGTGCGSAVSTSPCSSDNKSVACPEGTSVLTQNRNASNSVHKSEILQAERVQIKCSEIPPGLQIFQNMELASHNETDLLQCSLASLQSSEDVVLCSYQSLAVRKDKQKLEAGMLTYSSRHRLPTRTEVTVVRTPPSCRTFKKYPMPSRSVITQSIKAKKKSEMPFLAKVKEDGNSSNVQFKILRLPFDIQNHNQPCQLEASIWSVESLIPYVPSSEWMTKNGILSTQKHLNPLIEPSEIVSKPNYVPVVKNIQTDASTKYHSLSHQLEASIWSVESLRPYVPSNEWMVENGVLTPQKPLSPQINSSYVRSEPSRSSIKSIPVGKNLKTGASTKYTGLPHQLEASIWSVESLRPYVPSNELMAETGVLTPQKPLSPQINSSYVQSESNRSSTKGIPIGKNLKTGASTKYNGLPHQLEASIWSVESLRAYVPSNELMAENGVLTPQKPLSPQINSSYVQSEPNQSSTKSIPVGKNQKIPASTKYNGLPHQLEASIWSVESLRPYVPSNEWLVENGFLTPQKTLRPQIKSSNVLSELNQSFTNGIPVGKNQKTGPSTKCEDSLSSLKAHSPYRPSTSWLADFGNVYYYSKLPIVRQQPNIPERELPKMSPAISLESSLKSGKETKNQRAADQKHSSLHTCKRKAKSSPRHAGSAVMHGSISHSTLEKKLPFCPSCRYDTKGKDHRKHSCLDGLGWKREEIAEVNTYDEKRATGGVHKTQEMILGSHLAKCRAAYQPKIRDQPGLCENCQCLNVSSAQNKCADLEWRTWEKSGEDWNINPKKRSLQRLQKDNAWTGIIQASKTERIQKKERKEYLQGPSSFHAPELTQYNAMHTPWRA